MKPVLRALTRSGGGIVRRRRLLCSGPIKDAAKAMEPSKHLNVASLVQTLDRVESERKELKQETEREKGSIQRLEEEERYFREMYAGTYGERLEHESIKDVERRERIALEMLRLTSRDLEHRRRNLEALALKEERLDRLELFTLQERRRLGAAGAHRSGMGRSSQTSWSRWAKQLFVQQSKINLSDLISLQNIDPARTLATYKPFSLGIDQTYELRDRRELGLAVLSLWLERFLKHQSAGWNSIGVEANPLVYITGARGLGVSRMMQAIISKPQKPGNRQLPQHMLKPLKDEELKYRMINAVIEDGVLHEDFARTMQNAVNVVVTFGPGMSRERDDDELPSAEDALVVRVLYSYFRPQLQSAAATDVASSDPKQRLQKILHKSPKNSGKKGYPMRRQMQLLRQQQQDLQERQPKSPQIGFYEFVKSIDFDSVPSLEKAIQIIREDIMEQRAKASSNRVETLEDTPHIVLGIDEFLEGARRELPDLEVLVSALGELMDNDPFVHILVSCDSRMKMEQAIKNSARSSFPLDVNPLTASSVHSFVRRYHQNKRWNAVNWKQDQVCIEFIHACRGDPGLLNIVFPLLEPDMPSVLALVKQVTRDTRFSAFSGIKFDPATEDCGLALIYSILGVSAGQGRIAPQDLLENIDFFREQGLLSGGLENPHITPLAWISWRFHPNWQLADPMTQCVTKLAETVIGVSPADSGKRAAGGSYGGNDYISRYHPFYADRIVAFIALRGLCISINPSRQLAKQLPESSRSPVSMHQCLSLQGGEVVPHYVSMNSGNATMTLPAPFQTPLSFAIDHPKVVRVQIEELVEDFDPVANTLYVVGDELALLALSDVTPAVKDEAVDEPKTASLAASGLKGGKKKASASTLGRQGANTRTGELRKAKAVVVEEEEGGGDVGQQAEKAPVVLFVFDFKPYSSSNQADLSEATTLLLGDRFSGIPLLQRFSENDRLGYVIVPAPLAPDQQDGRKYFPSGHPGDDFCPEMIRSLIDAAEVNNQNNLLPNLGDGKPPPAWADWKSNKNWDKMKDFVSQIAVLDFDHVQKLFGPTFPLTAQNFDNASLFQEHRRAQENPFEFVQEAIIQDSNEAMEPTSSEPNMETCEEAKSDQAEQRNVGLSRLERRKRLRNEEDGAKNPSARIRRPRARARARPSVAAAASAPDQPQSDSVPQHYQVVSSSEIDRLLDDLKYPSEPLTVSKLETHEGEGLMMTYRAYLASLSRRDLQAEAKKAGVKANGKSTKIVKALLALSVPEEEEEPLLPQAAVLEADQGDKSDHNADDKEKNDEYENWLDEEDEDLRPITELTDEYLDEHLDRADFRAFDNPMDDDHLGYDEDDDFDEENSSR